MDSQPEHRLLEPESTETNHIVAFTVWSKSWIWCIRLKLHKCFFDLHGSSYNLVLIAVMDKTCNRQPPLDEHGMDAKVSTEV